MAGTLGSTHFFRLIRWENLVIVLFTQLFTYTFLQQNSCFYTSLDWRLPFVCASTLLLAGGGYIINDYLDVKIDVINKPAGLIVGRLISRRKSLVMHLVFTSVGILLGIAVNPFLGVIDFGVALLLWRYSSTYKYRYFIGNLIIALMMGLSLIVMYFSGAKPDLPWLIFYSFFAFLTGLIREIVKDVEDQEGDARNNCRTLPIVLGLYKTKLMLYYLIMAALSLLALACVYLFYMRYYVLPFYLILVIALPVIIFFIRLVRADTKRDFHQLSSVAKLIMLAGILSMALKCLP